MATPDPGHYRPHRIVAVVSVLLVGANVPAGVLLIAFKVLLGVNLPAKYGISSALVAAVLLLPVWAPVISHYRGTVVLLAAAGAAVASGTLLSSLATVDHAVSTQHELSIALMIVSAFGAIGVLLWASEALGVPTVVIVFGLGLTASHVLDHAGWAANPWKYGFALPVAIIGVGISSRARSPSAGIFVLLGVGLVSVVSDYRSFAGFCLISILVLTWQIASRSSRERVNKAAPIIMLAAVGSGTYFLLSNLLTGGYLGAGLQERSLAQVETSGSLLVGGRPEWAATIRLFAERPQGFGFGVLPNSLDIGIGDAGLASVNIDPANGYEAYMFGGGFRLHSIIADLWAAAGWGGILLCVIVLVILIQRLSTALADRDATPVLIFMTVIAIWALAFSPVYTDLKDLTLAVFVALASRRASGTADEPEPRSPDGAAAQPEVSA